MRGGNKIATMIENIDGKINFLVPDLTIIQKSLNDNKVNCQSPGTIDENIQNYAKIESVQNQSHKICLDGKKYLYI